MPCLTSLQRSLNELSKSMLNPESKLKNLDFEFDLD